MDLWVFWASRDLRAYKAYHDCGVTCPMNRDIEIKNGDTVAFLWIAVAQTYIINSIQLGIYERLWPVDAGHFDKRLRSTIGSVMNRWQSASFQFKGGGGGRYVYIADVDAENCIPWWRVGVGYDFPYDDSTWFLYRIISVRQRYDLPHDSVFQKDKLPDVYNIFAIVVARLIDKLRSTLILGQTKKIK